MRAFENEVLGWVADDYEAPHTLAADLSRELARSVSENEVRAALLALARKKMVQAYAYEAGSQRYKPISHAEAEASPDPWFMVTLDGASALDRRAN